MAKTLKLYYKTDNDTIFRLTPQRCPDLHKLVTHKWDDISKQYNEITESDKRKGSVVHYQLEKEGFSLLKKEVKMKGTRLVVYFNSGNSPILIITQQRKTTPISDDVDIVNHKEEE